MSQTGKGQGGHIRSNHNNPVYHPEPDPFCVVSEAPSAERVPPYESSQASLFHTLPPRLAVPEGGC